VQGREPRSALRATQTLLKAQASHPLPTLSLVGRGLNAPAVKGMSDAAPFVPALAPSYA